MVRQTKRDIIEEFKAVIDEHQLLTDKLVQLVDEDKVNSGNLMVLATCNTMPCEWLYGETSRKGCPCKLYGWGFAHTSKGLFVVYLENMKKEVVRLTDFIERPQHGWKGYTDVK